MFKEKPNKQPIEHLGTPNENENDEDNNKAKKKPDTLFYKPEDKKLNKEERGVAIDAVKLEEKEDRKKEELTQRFTELALMLESGEVRTEVMVAGEKQSLAITDLLKGGEKIEPAKLMEDLEKLDLSKIDAKFNLQWIGGGEEEKRTLTIDCTMPIINILEGKGEMSKGIEKAVTEVFAGTSKHYKEIREMEKDGKIEEQERLDKPTYQQQKKDTIDHLKERGLQITILEAEDRLTIIADHPEKGTQILVSLMNRQPPWHVEGIRKKGEQQSSTGIISGQPQEAISNVNKILNENP